MKIGFALITTSPFFNKMIAELTTEMKKAAELLQFELAAQIRDEISRLRAEAEKE